MKTETLQNFCKPLNFCITQPNHLHSPSGYVEQSVKLFGACQLHHEGCNSGFRQAQVYMPRNTASRLLLLKEEPRWFEGCPLPFPQAWLPGFREHCKDKKGSPSCLCCLTEDTRRRQRRWHALAPRCTWSGRLEKPSLLKLLVSAFSRVQWKLLTWLLNDGWQLGVWSLTRTKH